MAKHIVKCPYCQKNFDSSLEPFVQIQNGHRYAHKACYDKAQRDLEQTEKDEIALREYIKALFKCDRIPEKIEHQLKVFIKEKGYTYSGILKTLKYVFEVKKNPIEKANGGIGIVAFCYPQAREYWYNLWVARERNKQLVEQIKSSEAKMEIKEIHIRSPERQPMKHRRKLFTFLNEEEEESG